MAGQGVPLVLTVHNQRPGWPAGLAALGAGDAALLVACSRAVEAELAAAGSPIPVRTAWNGIDPAAFAPSPARAEAGRAFRAAAGARARPTSCSWRWPTPGRRSGSTGSPASWPRPEAELARRGSGREARLVIAGEASPTSPGAVEAAEAVRAEVDRLGLAEHVRWAGPVDDVAAALAGSDVAGLDQRPRGAQPGAARGPGRRGPRRRHRRRGRLRAGPRRPGRRPSCRSTPRPSGSPRSWPTGPRRRSRRRSRRDFTRSTMAARYAWLYPRAIARARPRVRGDGLLLVTNNFSIGGAQTSARRLLIGLADRGVRARAGGPPGGARPTRRPGRLALRDAGVPVLALPPAGSVDPALAVARLLGHADDDPPAAVLLWNVIPEYRVLIADGLIDVPLFDVSPGALSFDALDRYFARPRPGLPYRDRRRVRRPAGRGDRQVPRRGRAGRRRRSGPPSTSSPTACRSTTRPAGPPGDRLVDRDLGPDQPPEAARTADRGRPARPPVDAALRAPGRRRGRAGLRGLRRGAPAAGRGAAGGVARAAGRPVGVPRRPRPLRPGGRARRLPERLARGDGRRPRRSSPPTSAGWPSRSRTASTAGSSAATTSDALAAALVEAAGDAGRRAALGRGRPGPRGRAVRPRSDGRALSAGLPGGPGTAAGRIRLTCQVTAPAAPPEADTRLNSHVQSVLTTQIAVWYCHRIDREGGDPANSRPPRRGG